MTTSFPVGSRVILHGLKKEDFNGKIGVVKKKPSGERQEIFVDGCLFNLKMINLKFHEKTTTSLTVKEMKAVLSAKGVEEKEVSGLSKSELASMVDAKCPDGQEKMRHIAEANAPAPAPARSAATANTAAAAAATTAGINADTIRSQADMMASMDPAQLRQQAQMMRTMTPSQIRNSNPAMRNFSDAQIQMAATQMEMMANNPSMMKAAAEQMKNMNQSDLENMQRQMGGGAGGPTNGASTTAFPSSQYGTVPANGQQMSMQQAQEQMANMTPEQLRQQAQMMKSMSPDQLRAMNPAMKNISDDQIHSAISQVEQMANNPEMMNMVRDQMKGMSAEDIEELRKCQEEMFGNGAANGGQGMPTDPSQMDPSKMDPKSVKKMVSLLKKNPQMLKSMMASQPGMAGATDGMSDAQLEAMLNTFDGMSEEQVAMTMGMMGKAQKILGPITALWRKANQAAGGQLGKILLLLVVFYIVRSLMNRISGGIAPDGGAEVLVPVKDTIVNSAQSGATMEQELDEFAEEL